MLIWVKKTYSVLNFSAFVVISMVSEKLQLELLVSMNSWRMIPQIQIVCKSKKHLFNWISCMQVSPYLVTEIPSGLAGPTFIVSRIPGRNYLSFYFDWLALCLGFLILQLVILCEFPGGCSFILATYSYFRPDDKVSLECLCVAVVGWPWAPGSEFSFLRNSLRPSLPKMPVCSLPWNQHGSD